MVNNLNTKWELHARAEARISRATSKLKTRGISERLRGRAMRQIVGYKKDPSKGYTHTLLCFRQEAIRRTS